MMSWTRTELCPPPAGFKVLCFRNGDCWTAYRFSYKAKNIWIAAVPSCNLNPHRQFQMGRCDEPDYWAEIPFDKLPGKYTGRMMVKAEGDDTLYTLDDFQKAYPKEHDHFVKNFVNAPATPGKKNGKRS